MPFWFSLGDRTGVNPSGKVAKYALDRLGLAAGRALAEVSPVSAIVGFVSKKITARRLPEATARAHDYR